MKKSVLTYGLMSGVLMSAILAVIVHYIDTMEFAKEDFLGYTSMALAGLFVFFGIRTFREGAGGGRMTFFQGFTVGVLISLISTAVYVATFQLLYFKLMPGLGEKYAMCMVERAKASGGSAKSIVEAARKAAELKRLFDRPATNAALTFAEAFPVGLVVSVVSAAILKKGRADR